ncbi:MAG: ABC transporter ATP-binding protein, partial [Lachnospiraceae bacterium]|nr:ABC transporter ATP-binding protein [Lachnospiraceae bacterium]
ALDPIAEAKMSEAILSAANQTTTIMIAHRLSTIRDADRIVVFDRGRICECGSHGELMALHGKYWEMFTRQAENYVKG